MRAGEEGECSGVGALAAGGVVVDKGASCNCDAVDDGFAESGFEPGPSGEAEAWARDGGEFIAQVTLHHRAAGACAGVGDLDPDGDCLADVRGLLAAVLICGSTKESVGKQEGIGPCPRPRCSPQRRSGGS